VTKILALDCEFVKSSTKDLLARVSIVNSRGELVFDTLVNPEEYISDYITHITGITPEMLKDAPSYTIVNLKVTKLI